MTNTPAGAAVPQDAKPVNTNDLRDYADEISNPYAQLILDAAHQLDVARTDRNILDGLVSDLCARLKATTALVEKLESEAYQLRAALTPPADDEIGAIRGRHEAALARMADNNWPMSEGRQDVAALLEMVDKMRAAQ